MMKLRPTMQAMPDAPRMPLGIQFSAGQPMQPDTMQSLQSSPFDRRALRKPGILGGQPTGQPNIYGGQGPANIIPDANGNVGNPNQNGVANSLFQTPGMDKMKDQISRMLMSGGQGGG